MTTATKTATRGMTAVATKAWRISGSARRGGTFGVESASKTLLIWRVRIDTSGNMTCMGDSDGGRCWPFYHAATCKHTARVETLLNEEAAEAETLRAFRAYRAEATVLVAKAARKIRLEDLFELGG